MWLGNYMCVQGNLGKCFLSPLLSIIFKFNVTHVWAIYIYSDVLNMMMDRALVPLSQPYLSPDLFLAIFLSWVSLSFIYNGVVVNSSMHRSQTVFQIWVTVIFFHKVFHSNPLHQENIHFIYLYFLCFFHLWQVKRVQFGKVVSTFTRKPLYFLPLFGYTWNNVKKVQKVPKMW